MQIDITIKNYRCFSDTKPARITLKKGFTALVGVNNSGKSSILKFFYEFRDLFAQILPNRAFISALQGSPQSFTYADTVLDTEEVFSNINDRNIEIEIKFHFKQPPTSNNNDPFIAPFPKKVTLTIPRGTNTWTAKLQLKSGIPTSQEDAFQFHKERAVLSVSRPNTQHTQHEVDLFILSEVSNIFQKALYIGPFRNAINVGTKEDYFDIQVGQSFIQHWRELKTGPQKKASTATYKLTQDIKNIFGFNDLQIDPSADAKTLQVFVNGRPYNLLELGSGLAQFIIVLANASIKQPSYILIDEPELNLHPSLQLDFLTTLASYASEGIVFATHNIGLARAASDQIYSLRLNTKGESEITDLETTSRLSEFLGEISFSGYREMGFEKILLVEGSSNVKTFQQFLRLYKKDHQIVLLPLGGSDMIKKNVETELQEIKRISDNIFAIIDSERKDPNDPLGKDRLAFVEACERVGISCHVLERRAIEKLLLR